MEEAIIQFFNDLRDNKPPTLSNIMKLLKEQAEINKETASGLNAVIQLMKPIEKKQIKSKIPDYIG